MDFYKLFYFLTIGAKLSTLFAWIGVSSAVICTISTLITLLCPEDELEEDNLKKSWYKNGKRIQRFSFILFPIFLVLWTATPNKKEAVLIIGGGYVGNFITTDSSSKAIPSDIIYFLRSNLQLAAKEAQVEISNLSEKDTLKDKSKEELIDLIKSQK